MPALYLRKRRVESVFNLLGEQENDITFSLGWALSRSSLFLQRFLRRILDSSPGCDEDELVVALQEFDRKFGITDIEIRSPQLHVIVEAKRGWSLPSSTQLKKYVRRFRETKADLPIIVTMSECSADYANAYGPLAVDGVRVRHMSWTEVSTLSHIHGGTHAERRLMTELRNYIATIVNTQKQESNWVYVLSLGDWKWRGLNFIQVVEERRRYFHPYGTGGWPKEPPNYLGFRYGGRLQRIYHVESAEVVKNLHPYFPEYPDRVEKPRILYKLGPAIIPSKIVKTGKIYANGRVWAMLDLLLTSKSISSARTASYARIEEM